MHPVCAAALTPIDIALQLTGTLTWVLIAGCVLGAFGWWTTKGVRGCWFFFTHDLPIMRRNRALRRKHPNSEFM